MIRTRVLCSQSELNQIRALVDKARASRSIFVGSHFPNMVSIFVHEAKKKCHEIAMSYGLPEIEGWYGIRSNGEFTEETFQ